MPAIPPAHRGPQFVLGTTGHAQTSLNHEWREYLDRGNWRCSAGGGAHDSIFDEERKVFVCRRCGQERKAKLWVEEKERD